MTSFPISDFTSAVARIYEAANKEEVWSAATAHALVDFIYHSYKGDPSELPDRESLFTADLLIGKFNKPLCESLHSKIERIAEKILDKKTEGTTFPITATGIFKNRIRTLY